MRTLGSEAGRSEERAARRPTSRRNRASVCASTSPARRVHGAKVLYARTACVFVCAFCREANRCFKSKVCIVARTDANRYRSLRALGYRPTAYAYRPRAFLAQPFPHCPLNKFTYRTESAHAFFSRAHHPHLHSSGCRSHRSPPCGERRPTLFWRIRSAPKTKVPSFGLHKACPTWQLLL